MVVRLPGCAEIQLHRQGEQVKQFNQNYTGGNICNRELEKYLLTHSSILDLPKLTDYMAAANEQEEAFDQLLKKNDERSPFHFLQLIVQNEVYEKSPYFEHNIKNETIEKLCSGTRASDDDIKFSKLKIFLMQRHIQFVHDTIDVYRKMLEAHNALAEKNRITQKDVDDELSNKIVLSKINSSLNDTESHKSKAMFSLIPTNDEKDIYPYLENAKMIGLSFKELKKSYPNYRSSSNDHTEFLHFVAIYSYYFFLNHFTYENKETAAQFAYSTREYISTEPVGEWYQPYIEFDALFSSRSVSVEIFGQCTCCGNILYF